MLVNIDLTEKEEKRVREELRLDKDFILNAIKEKIGDMEEEEKMTPREEKRLLRRLEKSRGEKGRPIEEFFEEMGL